MQPNTPEECPENTNQVIKHTIVRTADLENLKNDNNRLRHDNVATVTQNTGAMFQIRQLQAENEILQNRLISSQLMQADMHSQINTLKQEKLLLQEAMMEWARLEWMWKGEKARLEAVVRNLQETNDGLRPLRE